jgi:hypothetical protein
MDKVLLINALTALGRRLGDKDEALEAVIRRTEAENPWFTTDNQYCALERIIGQFLDEKKLTRWLEKYPEPVSRPLKIGLVLAGNIPFVGFHDVLCVLASGHHAYLKLSSKDKRFLPYMKEQLEEIEPELAARMHISEQLKGMDAVIATGSNNTSRYFEYYFGSKPHIFRKNRTSVAILDGNESEEELMELGKDVFDYFGLGCRNVGKLYLPKGYDPTGLLALWEAYSSISDHTKYKNNLDYNLTLTLLNEEHPYASSFLILKETASMHAPLATVYYEFYVPAESKPLELPLDEIQCVVSSRPGNTAFGQTQVPALEDYADHVDTMAFLHGLGA